MGGGKWGERGGGGPILNGFESVSGTLEAFRINICNSVIIMLSVIRWKWVRARAVLKKQREKSNPTRLNHLTKNIIEGITRPIIEA